MKLILQQEKKKLCKNNRERSKERATRKNINPTETIIKTDKEKRRSGKIEITNNSESNTITNRDQMIRTNRSRRGINTIKMKNINFRGKSTKISLISNKKKSPTINNDTIRSRELRELKAKRGSIRKEAMKTILRNSKNDNNSILKNKRSAKRRAWKLNSLRTTNPLLKVDLKVLDSEKVFI